MRRTFLLDVDTAGDSDLIGLSDDILAAVIDKGINALACRPWKSSTEPASGKMTWNIPQQPSAQPPPPI